MSEEVKTSPAQPTDPRLRREPVSWTGPLTGTEPHPAPLDSGPASGPATVAWSPSDEGDDAAATSDAAGSGAGSADDVDPEALDTADAAQDATGAAVPIRLPPAPATSMVLRGQYHHVKWWKVLLIFAAVWIPAAGIGLGLFSLWYSLVDKSPAVFAVLVYAVVCTVSGTILAMVPDRPLVSVLAVAVVSAVFAAGLGAAPLYGYRYCQVQGPCLLKVIPY